MYKIIAALALFFSSLPALAAKIPVTVACPAGQRSAQVYENACPKESKKTCWVLTKICVADKPQ
jgi:hypothetical protein